jgi:predicted AAA+ superfamily ATPase
LSIPIELSDQNPWWKNKSAIEKDRDILNLREAKVKWQPRLKHMFDFDKDIIYTLRGPRQVGKTTLVKEMIRERLETEAPRNVFYYTCNLVDNPKQLVETVSAFLDSADRKKRTFVFLDEVSSIRDWQKGVKHLVDTGKFAKTTVVLTGSHSLDIKRASERLPGRRGISSNPPDKILMPMKFAEYVETLSPELHEFIRGNLLLQWDHRREIILSLFRGRIPDVVRDIQLYAKELSRLLKDYLITGGIARVVNEYVGKREISESTYRTYIDAVLGDLSKWGRRESYVRQIVGRVIDTSGSAVSWNALKDNTDMASHVTAAEYIDDISDTFAMLYIHRLDTTSKGAAFQKEKKIYFHDPFFFHAFRAWSKGGSPWSSSNDFLKDERNQANLLEGVVADHLVRLAFSLSLQKHLFEYRNSLYFWRSKKDREVDFVLVDHRSKYLPVELKYQRKISREDRFGLIDFSKVAGGNSGGSLLLSRDRLEMKRGALTMPVWAFLLLI